MNFYKQYMDTKFLTYHEDWYSGNYNVFYRLSLIIHHKFKEDIDADFT